MVITLEKILKKLRPEEYDIVYEEDKCIVFFPKTEKATAYLSYGTKWDINSGKFSIDNRNILVYNPFDECHFFIEWSKINPNKKRLYYFGNGYYYDEKLEEGAFEYLSKTKKTNAIAKHLTENYMIKPKTELFFNRYPLESLYDLTHAGAGLSLRGSPLKDLGRLKKVNIDLELDWSRIESLGDLEYVGGSLGLTFTKIDNLDNLKHVGWRIFIKNSDLYHKYTINELEQMYPRFKGKFTI